MEKSRKPVSLARKKTNHASIRGFLRSYSAAILSPSLTTRPWGRVFRFSAEIGIRDYIINIHVTPFVVEGARFPLPSPSPPVGVETDAVHEAPSSRARDTCAAREPRALIQYTRSRVLYMAGTISALRTYRTYLPPLSPSPSSSSPLRGIPPSLLLACVCSHSSRY